MIVKYTCLYMVVMTNMVIICENL